MDMNPPLDGPCCWIDIKGPYEKYEDLDNNLGVGHPANAIEDETLHYYDGPVIMICHVSGDDRPRLDILIDEEISGDEGRKHYSFLRHQLVFDTMETLRATLHNEGIPTRQSYEMAESIIRLKSCGTQTNHPTPSHSMIMAKVGVEDLPENELPLREHQPQGLKTPNTKDINS